MTTAFRASINSSNLQTAAYDPSRECLEIQFKSGAVYDYYAVPEEIFAELISAESAGRFFAAEIKDKFECERISA